ncbi:hypothetical protein ACFO5R_01500 [Halosolutus amylolyticus]|uniref:Uncharacterized protein n=1 Tax=Halosolutus amylolyticus TaxID=2932267 RepID=A0ABD5PKZ8_9EURY|nr:hypothetical protein [Halosolutus amylolyticus]
MSILDEATTDGGEEPDGTSPLRRTVLGAIGALAGAAALSNPGAARQEDGRVETRGCSDAALTPDDWSDGAVTVEACPTGGGQVLVSVTGRVSPDRYVASTAGLPSTETIAVPPGGRQTLWFTGRLTRLACSNGDLNIGIAHRG